MNLPLIIGFGGINPAGRSSFHQSYRRTVVESLPLEQRNETLLELAALMNLARWKSGRWENEAGETFEPSNLPESLKREVLEGTLVRRLESPSFCEDRLPASRSLSVTPANPSESVKITFSNAVVETDKVNGAWKRLEGEGRDGLVFENEGSTNLLIGGFREPHVRAAGQLPRGFDPRSLYPCANHPAGIVYAVCGMGDALQTLGMDWRTLAGSLPADRVGVYASSSMGQLDEWSGGGFLRAFHNGRRPNSKQLPFSFPEMAGDFVNSYVLGNAGHTMGAVGACATMLFNLYSASEDIRLGKRDLAVVGCSEAPLNPETIAGYHAMSALADDFSLARLDGVEVERVNHRRACRPFAPNCGFVMGESAQFIVLASETLAVEKGCRCWGAVGGVHVSADGYKRSISKPGIGNYATFFKSLAIASAIVGEKALKNHGFVYAHGTGTPQNRVSESQIMSKAALLHGIEDWKITSVKSRLGHPLGAAGGDQIASALGVWEHGLIPGIKTIEELAPDVHQKGLRFLIEDEAIDVRAAKAAVVNSKGFGGNNATAVLLSPFQAELMAEKRFGKAKMADYRRKRETTEKNLETSRKSVRRGVFKPVYDVDGELTDFDQIKIDRSELKIPSRGVRVSLQVNNPFER